jgi:iron complex transport system substrate-binding protein
VRIVSLVPDGTEIAFALGLADAVVGVTHECDWPPEARERPAVTRSVMPEEVGRDSAAIDAFVRARAAAGEPMVELDEDLLRRLAPDLLIAQSLCEVCAVPESLVGRAVQALGGKVRLVVLAPRTLAEVLEDVRVLGRATGREAEAERVVAEARRRLDAVRARVAGLPRPRTVVLEWLDPPWASGHWAPEMVEAAGGLEVLGAAGAPSREARWEEVVAARPEALVLAPCGFTVGRTLEEAGRLAARPGFEDLPAVRQGRVFVVDANGLLSRPGPRLVRGVEVLAACLHPDRFDPPAADEAVRLPAAVRGGSR